MSKAVHSRVRFMLTLFIVAMTIPWNLSNVSASYATPPDQPDQVEPTATTEVPVATDIPVEPTATNVPAQSTATEVPTEPTATNASTETPTETSIPTATETPEPEFSSSAVFSYVGVEFRLCADDTRIGETDMQYFGGSFNGAGTIDQCRAPQGVTITLTDVAGVHGPYVFEIPAGQSGFQLYNQVQEATYIVSYAPTGASTFPAGSFADPIVLSFNGEIEGQFSLSIQLYVASETEPDPIPTGTGTIGVDLASCQDPDRAGQTDFQINSLTGVSVDHCEGSAFPGQVVFTLAGFTSDGTPYGPFSAGDDCCGSYEFGEVPYGTYTITESIYGNESQPFVVGGVNGSTPRILVRNYFADEPVYKVALQAALRSCEDPSRADQLDYLLVQSDYSATSTCFDNSAIPSSLVLSIIDSEDNVAATTTNFTGGYNFVLGLDPGTYTAQLEGYPESQPFELQGGVVNYLDVIIYSSFGITPAPPEPGEGARMSGAVAYCTSDELAGQVQYVLDIEFFATGTGQCVDSTEDSGVLHVYRYENSGDSEPVETWSLPVIQSRFHSDMVGGFPAGYYRIGYAPSNFLEPISLSAEFPQRSSGTTNVSVYYYGEQVETSLLQIRKDICYSDDRADTADFYFQQEEIGLIFATDETIQCRVATPADGEFTYTLTDTETGESVASSTFIFPLPLAYMSGIPAGTYTLTEQNGPFSRTSEPFEFDPSGGDYSVLVRNYLAGELPPTTGEPQDGGILLWAYDCVNDAKAGTSEFFYNPGIFGTIPGIPAPQGEFAASSVENCVASGVYSFELENSASETLPMIPGDTGQDHVYTTSPDGVTPGPVPAGSYVIRETTTGAESEVIDINLPIGVAAFYNYGAAPTPTPSPTTTPEPTATPTETPVAPAELVVTDFTLNVSAGQTISGNLNDYVSGGVPPYTFAAGTLPTQGTLVVNPDGTFTLTVNADAVGTDSFTFTVTDSQVELAASATDSGLATIIIAAPGETPVVTPTVNTGTVEPGGDPDGDDGDGNDPRATAPAGNPGDGSGGVTTLPSTGQGQNQSWNGLLQVLLLTGLALILLAAGIRQHGRRS